MVAGKINRSYDIFIAEPGTAEIVLSLSSPEDLCVVGVLLPPDSSEPLPRRLAEAGFSRLSMSNTIHAFEGIVAWVSGAVAIVSKNRAIHDKNAANGRRYEELVQALPDMVYELDPEGVLVFINESVSVLGYKPSDLIGKHYSVLLHDDDAAAVDRDMVLPEFSGYKTGLALSPKLFNERRSIDRRTTDLEVRLKKKPGSAGFDPELIGSVISYGEVSAAGEYGKDDKQTFKGSVGIIRDVTLRRKSEEMLRKLYQAVDQLGSCVFILNHTFDVEYVNPVFFLLTGFAPPDVIGRKVFKFFNFLPQTVTKLTKRVHDGFESSEEVLVPRVSGGQFWANFSIAPVRTPIGAITHTIVVIDDISSRKSMEELLCSARRTAEEANLSKSRLLLGMTHDLKDSIVGIMSGARLLTMAQGDSTEIGSAILERSQTLMDMLGDVLDYVRSEGNTGVIQRLTFPVDAFIERSCEKSQKLASSKALKYSLKVVTGETMETDPDRLGRVIEILTDIAVRRTQSGSISVNAIIDRQEGNVPHLVVNISDTGSGPKPGDRTKRFDVKSGGIPFALAKNMTLVLGGEIRVDCEPGAGCSFSVIVPVALPAKEPLDNPCHYSILIVDDNEVNLEYLRTLTENAGYRVHCAVNAHEAFRILETRYIDASLLDIHMPGFTGTQLAQSIRSYAGTRYSPTMPLFAMTAQSRDTIEDAHILFEEVFPKPADIKKVTTALEEKIRAKETVSASAIESAFVSTGLGHVAAVARIKQRTETALSALALALSGTNDTRVDIRSETSVLVNALQRFGCIHGQDLVRQFLEHYTDEDEEVLEGLLKRIRVMIGKGIAILESLPS
jgi:PAS domain S-box-containing protein